MKTILITSSSILIAITILFSNVSINKSSELAFVDLNKLAVAEAEDGDCNGVCIYSPGDYCVFEGFYIANYREGCL
jgi:hypothetical protein